MTATMLIRRCASVIAGLALCGSACAQDAPPQSAARRLPDVAGGFPPGQEIEGVPEFRELALQLVDVPKASGARVSLFDRDLSQFDSWLGYANGSLFPSGPDDKPLGATGIGDVFKVIEADGKPTIYIVGRPWGSLYTKREYDNYHLSVRYKLGRQWNEKQPRNFGVLYHSYGPNGAFAGTWMSSVEFEVMPGLTGLAVTIGREMRALVELGKGPGPGVFGREDLRYMPGGKLVQVRLPTMVKPHRDVELPAGQWNKLDLYVAGDRAVQVVNDAPVLALSTLALEGADGATRPLTRGRIQLESEGTEVYVRDLWIEPIRAVPRIVVAR